MKAGRGLEWWSQSPCESDYMYRKYEFLYMLHGICIEISDIVFGRNRTHCRRQWGIAQDFRQYQIIKAASDIRAVRTLTSCRIAI